MFRVDGRIISAGTLCVFLHFVPGWVREYSDPTHTWVPTQQRSQKISNHSSIPQVEHVDVSAFLTKKLCASAYPIYCIHKLRSLCFENTLYTPWSYKPVILDTRHVYSKGSMPYCTSEAVFFVVADVLVSSASFLAELSVSSPRNDLFL